MTEKATREAGEELSEEKRVLKEPRWTNVLKKKRLVTAPEAEAEYRLYFEKNTLQQRNWHYAKEGQFGKYIPICRWVCCSARLSFIT